MGFFKDLRDDISQAVNELLPDDDFFGMEEEDTAEGEFLHLEEEKAQSVLENASLDKQDDTLLSKEEPEFNETEIEKTVDEEVQEDILSVLAHLDEDMAAESGVDKIENENLEEDTAEEGIADYQEENGAMEEILAEQPEEDSVMEQLPDDAEMEYAEMELSGTKEDEEESNETMEDTSVSDLENEEIEVGLEDTILDGEDFSEEELLNEEPTSDILETEVSEEENEDFLETEALVETSETGLLEEAIQDEEASMDLVEEELDAEPVELQSDTESELEEPVSIQGLGMEEPEDTFSDSIVNNEEDECSLTNMQSVDTMDEENSEETATEDLEDVPMAENFETFINEQQDEERMSDGEMAEVTEPKIQENIIEKGENIMENNLENVQATGQVTVITKGTVINGSISSDGGLEVNGTITGDVECLGKLSVNGNVSGHLKAAEVVVSTPRLDGGIDSQGDVKIGVGTIVIGDVTAKSATISGAVKGEIDVQGPVVVDSTAIVKGNITAKSVQINNGAVVDGYCKLSYAEVDIDNFFDGE